MTPLLLIIADESLSMRSRKLEILDGINQFIDVQRKVSAEDGRLILVKFNNLVTFLHKGTELSEVEPLRTTDYNPAGRTSFFDAVHAGITLADEIKRKDERVVCIIITDGEDTASRQNVSCKAMKKMVKKYDIKPDWSFTYIGKPPEYWTRKKPVSKISYECHTQKQVCQRHKSVTAASRRLREFATKKQLLAQ
ncbi:hypothetical protein RDWZM_002829 [Blomia tropicalis]|uniref:VWFA domain-containing protein n=1 Tax=Blomia tropicalis TaxID=40697 RepID=A0A9Q0MEW1_BLOTA|nr:hypothetical protein BLOT_001254 [Blomia tropicalis]KAJ6224284.1 hypothetical protein RDWZM_002829 [Blomia tropicalis]